MKSIVERIYIVNPNENEKCIKSKVSGTSLRHVLELGFMADMEGNMWV